MSGVFAISRGVFDHPMFAPERYTEREAWIWIVGAAAWKAKRVRVKDTMFDLERGQCVFSLRFLAQKWKWSKDKVSRFLSRLKIETMIETQARRDATLITVCNYDEYQMTPGFTQDAERDANKDTDETQTRRRRDKEEYLNKGINKKEEKKDTGKKLLPDDWAVKPSHYEIGLKKNLTPSEVQEAANEMRAWSLGNGERRANWDWVFNNWLSRNAERKGKRNGYGGSRPLQNAGYGDTDKSVVAASDRLIEKLRAFDEPAPSELRGGEGQASLRLISKG